MIELYIFITNGTGVANVFQKKYHVPKLPENLLEKPDQG